MVLIVDGNSGHVAQGKIGLVGEKKSDLRLDLIECLE